MAWAKLTLIGLQSYELSQTPPMSLFSGWAMPVDDDGNAMLDKDMLINTIMMRGGELPVVYPDPDILRYMITTWGHTHKDAMRRMALVMSEDYNPIHNYDRMEEESSTGTRATSEDSTGTDSGSSSRTTSGQTSDSSTGSTHTDGSTVNEQENTAYDSGTYAKVQKDTITVGDSQATVSASQSAREDAESSTEARTRTDARNASETRGDARRLHAYGNVGVTTSAQMVEEEMLLRKRFNVYETLAEMFIADFCVLVW